MAYGIPGRLGLPTRTEVEAQPSGVQKVVYILSNLNLVGIPCLSINIICMGRSCSRKFGIRFMAKDENFIYITVDVSKLLKLAVGSRGSMLYLGCFHSKNQDDDSKLNDVLKLNCKPDWDGWIFNPFWGYSFSRQGNWRLQAILYLHMSISISISIYIYM